MWVNITLDELDIDIIMEVLVSLSKESEKLMLSINSTKDHKEIEATVKEIFNRCVQLGINVLRGPQFFGDSCIIDDEAMFVDELSFATVGKKIVWYLQKNNTWEGIKKVILVDAELGVDPFLIKQRTQDLPEYLEYYFMYQSLAVPEMPNLIGDEKYKFLRIRDKKEKYDNND